MNHHKISEFLCLNCGRKRFFCPNCRACFTCGQREIKEDYYIPYESDYTIKELFDKLQGD